MENGEEKQQQKEGASYRYWVRETTPEAAPPPVPRRLSPEDVLTHQSNTPALGSAWNKAGTWEEKSLNKWASDRIKDLLVSVDSLEFSTGKAKIKEVTRCVGDAVLVTVRNKKRVGYTYELTLKVEGEWIIKEEKKSLDCHIDIPEFSYGELDELEMEVRLSGETDGLHHEKQQIYKDLKLFLQPVREKLCQFEQELKDR